MGAWHVPELCCAVLDPKYGSIHLEGPRVLTHRQKGGKDVCAAKAMVLVLASMFSQ